MSPGRPSIYTPELAQRICEELSQGKSLREVCEPDEMPAESTVRKWAVNDEHGFYAHYAKAREVQAEKLADEILDIADNGRNDWMERNGDDERGWVANGEHIQRSRLRVDTRKWVLSKVLPKKYGERIVNEHSGPDGGAIPISVIQRVIVDPNAKD